MASSISTAGGNTIYIQYASSKLQYQINSTSAGGWSDLNAAPVSGYTITNSSPGSGTVKVIFTTDITITASSQYFVCGSTNIQFGSETLNANGTRPTITISNVANYVGFIGNGFSGADGYNTISVYNLIINPTGTTTQGTDGGWVCRTNFAKGATNNLVVNCSSSGTIKGGGIVGGFAARLGVTPTFNVASLTVRGCTSSGDITGTCGGIVGYNSATNNGCSLTVENCSSTGPIASGAGGITGAGCGTGTSVIEITNCYSTGPNTTGGGIFGQTTGGTSSATNCYSTGDIFSNGGGIYGANAGSAGGFASCTNCFSTGDINSAGGIYGSGYNASGATAYNCYTSGAASGLNAGGIWYNSSSDTLQGLNNYSESNNGSSGWRDSNVILTGKPVSTSYGSTWSQINGIDSAYVLSSSGYTPYSTDLVTTASGSVTAGASTDPAVVSGYTYSTTPLSVNSSQPSIFPYFTIHSSTGAITADASTPAGTYTIIVYSSINPYSITTYTLTVSAAASEAALLSQPNCCCAVVVQQTFPDYEAYTSRQEANPLICNQITNTRKQFPDYEMYLRYIKALALKGNPR